MTGASERHTDNIVIGSGALYIDVLDADGETTGERYLGDAVAAALAVAGERVEVFSGSGPVARRIVNRVRSLTRTLSMVLHDISMDNLALFAGVAAANEVPAAKGAVTGEARTVTPGRWYALGDPAADPSGAGAVSGVSVTGPDGDPAYAEGDDYALDAARGRL